MQGNKILIVIDQLTLGGAGRVCSILSNGLVDRGYDVTICTAVKYHPIRYNISDKVKISEWYDPEPVKHNFLGKIRNLRNRHKYYRSTLKRTNPEIIIAFTHHMFFYVKLWSYGYNIPIVVSDHTSMGRDLGRFSNFIRHKFYSKAAIVTILTKKDQKLIHGKLLNTRVVYNPVTFDNFDSKGQKENYILCVGRKDYWSVKGFDRIIEIWAKLARNNPDWVLRIIGPGNTLSEDYLKEMAKKLNVLDRIEFLGEQFEMQNEYQVASIFALPSRVEGFPMVLLEAMSQGCACVSFSMQGAIDEIIQDGVDGDIVDDNNLDAFASKLEDLMLDKSKRESYAINASQNVLRFSKDSFIDEWHKIIKLVLHSK